MVEFRRIELRLLDFNTGQIPGLPANPRAWTDAEIKKLAKSMKNTPELAEARGCIVVPRGDRFVVLGGNLRLSAAKFLKWRDIMCAVLPEDTKPAKLREVVLKDNSSFGSWDLSMLRAEWSDVDFGDWGINVTWDTAGPIPDVSMGETQHEVVEDDFDETTSDIEKLCKRGDIWQLGGHRLMCGDSTKVDDVQMLMGGAEADMVFTDPPYGINIVNSQGKVGAPRLAKNRTYKPVKNDDSTDTAARNFEVLKTLCSRMIIWGGNYFLQFLPPSDGWIVWDKRVDMNSNNFADGEMAWCSFHTPLRIYHQLWNGMIREGEHENRVHPTQKPVRMLSEVLRDFSGEADNILDCFGGSGSTLIACEQTGRRCYMMEYDEHYCDVIIARWEKFTGRKATKIDEQ